MYLWRSNPIIFLQSLLTHCPKSTLVNPTTVLILFLVEFHWHKTTYMIIYNNSMLDHLQSCLGTIQRNHAWKTDHCWCLWSRSQSMVGLSVIYLFVCLTVSIYLRVSTYLLIWPSVCLSTWPPTLFTLPTTHPIWSLSQFFISYLISNPIIPLGLLGRLYHGLFITPAVPSSIWPQVQAHEHMIHSPYNCSHQLECKVGVWYR